MIIKRTMDGLAIASQKEDSYICGLSGMYWSNLPRASQRAALIATLCVLNDSRGGQGWGYATLSGEMAKGEGKFGNSLAAEVVAQYPGAILHTRFATSGSSSAANAHPFRIGHVTGAHN